MPNGFVQVAPDSTGKSIDQSAVTVPAGTVVVGSDGSLTTLTADATYYRQRLVVSDPVDPHAVANVRGEVDRGALYIQSSELELLASISGTLGQISLLLQLALDK
jgi:hypothetical protein